MKAAVYDRFQAAIELREVPDPTPSPTGVVLRVKACGICRSDWHGWMGNDPDIKLPHVPGHELAGEIVAVGSQISTRGRLPADRRLDVQSRNFKLGERVTLPFVCGCGECEPCLAGDQQVCDRQFQPGFTAWGGFAQYVAIEYAENNLVRLPDEIDFVTAASLGCRFATSFRGVVDQGKVQPGQWVAVHGCGGVGLSAIMIAAAFDARVIAVDIAEDKLEFARTIGAETTVNASSVDVVEAILDITGGGAHLAIDALGEPDILMNSILSLRKRGCHIQIGIMKTGSHRPAVPIDCIIARELKIYGSHGMQAHRYPQMLEMIASGRLKPALLIGKSVPLNQAPAELMAMDRFPSIGITVIQ